MTVEERVVRILAELGAEVRPLPDPYERMRVGLRRRRRKRMIGLGLVLVTLLSASGIALAGAAGGKFDETADPEPDQGWDRVVAWTWRMADSAPRGAVAANAGYDTTVAELVLQRQRKGEIGAVGTAFTGARVLFADDVGPYRLALVALVRADPQPHFWPHAATWLVAAKGAGAVELAAGAQGVGDALEPYMQWYGSGAQSTESVFVGIAPEGCEFETATWPDEREWERESTGSYLVRTKEDRGREWWRLRCDGLVREVRPAPGTVVDDLTEAELVEATAGVRHGPPADAWREVITATAQEFGYALAGVPRAIWAGPISGVGGAPAGTAEVVAARAASGNGWLGQVRITYDEPDPVTGEIGSGVAFSMRDDPTDPSAALAIPLGDDDPPKDVLVVGAKDAVRVSAWREGGEIASAAAPEGAAVLSLPSTEGVDFQAYRADGSGGGSPGLASRSIGTPSGAGWDR